MGELINFAHQRKLRRPNELPHEVQEVLNLCSAEVNEVPALERSREGLDKGLYLRDLGRRMLITFKALSGTQVPRPVVNEYNRLDGDDQTEVQVALNNLRLQ